MKKTEILKIVQEIKNNNQPEPTADEPGFLELTYKGKYNGYDFMLHVYPKSDKWNSKGWNLRYDGKTIARKEGREAIELKISLDQLKMVIKGTDWIELERAEIEKQIEELKERKYELQNLVDYRLTY